MGVATFDVLFLKYCKKGREADGWTNLTLFGEKLVDQSPHCALLNQDEDDIEKIYEQVVSECVLDSTA